MKQKAFSFIALNQSVSFIRAASYEVPLGDHQDNPTHNLGYLSPDHLKA